MRVLELFAGSGSIGNAARELGMQVLSTDITAYPTIDVVGDVLQLPVKKWVEFQPDIIWASPPCTGFSVAAIGHHWAEGRQPKTSTACLGMALAIKTIEIIRACKPAIWYIENPVGMMRTMPFMKQLGRSQIIHYCQYGDSRQKPTDVWTNNPLWKPRTRCKKGAPCHEAAPRGSRTGTQGLKGAHDRSKIPHELCLEVLNTAAQQIAIAPMPLFPPIEVKHRDPFHEIIRDNKLRKEKATAPELFA